MSTANQHHVAPTTLSTTPKPSRWKFWQHWTLFEKLWIGIAVAVIAVVSIVIGESWIGFISSISGILCVIAAAKGKIATYYFGILQAATYAWISYSYALYGEAMLNALFFLPIQFIGLTIWEKHGKTADTAQYGENVYANRLSWKQWLVLVPSIIGIALIYRVFLMSIDAAEVGLDSFAVVISLFAQLLMVLRYAEQWLLWITVNVLTIILWLRTLASSEGADWAIFAMWCAFLVNSIYGYLNWRKLAKKDAQKETGSRDYNLVTRARIGGDWKQHKGYKKRFRCPHPHP